MPASRNPLYLLDTYKFRSFDQGDQNWRSCLRWSGPWTEGDTYVENQVALDSEWLMVANKITTDRPGPIKAGSPSYDLPQIPAFVEETFTGAAWTGHEYTLTEPGWITSIQAWAPELTNDTAYRFYFIDATDPDNQIVTVQEEPTLVENNWATINFPNAIYPAGTIIGVIMDALNSGSSTLVTGGWNRAGNAPSGDPGSQAWRTTSNESSLAISYTDLDSVDRTTELQGITAGTEITFVDTADPTLSMKWAIQAPGTDQGTYIQFDTVNYDGPGTGGVPTVGNPCTVSALIPVPSPTKYERIANHWTGNQPTWGTVRGLLRLGGVDQPADLDAFGVRLQFQPAQVSPDWDFLATLSQ